MAYHYLSIGKFEQGCICEDAALARKKCIAVSDGAGGGGLFAERWSRYLLKNLPDTPITSADALDEWIGKIWEPYYNDCEVSAQQLGGMSLEKFYDEGSFATLVAVWKTAPHTCQWMAFGDSVAFCYNRATKQLIHSFTRLADFDEPPYLINCKDELQKEGFRTGVFPYDSNTIIFAASDALSHYILMMYEISHLQQFRQEIDEAISRHSKNENYIKVALDNPHFDFEKDVLNKLLRYKSRRCSFEQYLHKLLEQGLLAHDDYSLTYFY